MILSNESIRDRTAQCKPRYVVYQGVTAIAPPRRRPQRTIPIRGAQLPAVQLAGTNYYALNGLDSIFGKIGKAIGKVAKGVVKVVGGVAKIALPVAAGVVGVKFLAPVVGKAAGGIFGKIFGKGQPQLPAPNPGIPLPGGWDMGQPSVPSSPPIQYQPSQQTAPGVAPQSYYGPTATDAASTAIVPAGVPGAAPAWLMPVAIGGAVLLGLTMMKPGRRIA